MKKIIAALLLSLSYWLDSTPAQADSAAPAATEIKLEVVSRDAGLTAVIGSESILLGDLKPKPTFLKDVKLSVDEKGGVRISSDKSVVIFVSSPAIKGWSAQLFSGSKATFNFNTSKSQVEVALDKSSSGSLLMTCDDGGRIDFSPGSSGKLDFFKNESYVFVGVGKVLAIDADGQSFDFSSSQVVAMVGGPLVLKKDANGKERWERASPTIWVKITGTPGKDLAVMVGGKTVYQTGDGKKTINIKELGASVTFSEKKSDESLRWFVDKGDFRFRIDSIPEWGSVAVTDQSASIAWDKPTKVVQLKNYSNTPMMVQLPRKMYAVVTAGSSIQYTPLTGKMFSVASAGGEARIFSFTGQEVGGLKGSSEVFDAARTGVPSGTGLPVRLSWDNGGPLEASGAAAYARLLPNSNQPIKFGKEGEADLAYSEGGFLTVTATQNDFKLQIKGINGLEIQLQEGDVVSLTLDLKKGTFVVKAADENYSTITITTESGYAPVLDPSKAMNFNIRPNDGLIASSGGQAVFYSPGAGDILSPVNREGKGPYERIDNPTVPITEPPVSAVR